MLALNRSAILVRPKSPFLDWLHGADPTSVTLTLADLRREPTIYLVPECGDAEDERAVLKTVVAGGWRVRAAARRFPGL
jgi:hypothetical protein